MYLSLAKELLNQEYQKYRENVKNNYFLSIIDEKIRHSYQVLGVGNFLLRHEEILSSGKVGQKSYLQAMALLHDVGRFYEMAVREKGLAVDHGVYGAELLSETKYFNAIDFTLPIKHHGHMIKQLYEDDAYQSLPLDMREKVEKSCFFVRDADKLANYYLLMSNFEEMKLLFCNSLEFGTNQTKAVSADVLDGFFQHRAILKETVYSLADKVLFFIAWIFDLNYVSSFVFLQKLDIIPRLFSLFSEYLDENTALRCKVEAENFILSKLNSAK